MMTTFYYDHELEKAKTVSDKELNELLQEVRAIEPRYYLVENKVLTKKKLFRKQKELTLYTLLYECGLPQVQVINFCQDHDWSINTNVTKSYIHTLLLGFLNGYNHNIKSSTPNGTTNE